jgi:lysophospholipid acyltransferase (LPLAT)-like uncharacterized protein
VKEVEQPRPRSLKTRLLARCIVFAVRALCATLRLRMDDEAEIDRLLENGGLLVTWHGRTMLPINHFRGRNRFFMLVSLSRDGDLQSEVMRANGYSVVRGSTGRRGVAATREVLAQLNLGGILAFTPDGPRGPSGTVQPGVVYFAQRSGKPIIPVGISASPRWLLGSWDRFLVPKPFARACWIYGDPIFVGPDEDLDHARARVQAEIDRLETAAEAAVRPSAA